MSRHRHPKKSGGSAANNRSITSTSNTPTNKNMNHTNAPITLKQAADQFLCAASSLKNNAKTGKLKATRTSPTAPFMVTLSDVEGFLKNTPGIKSIFHSGAQEPTTPHQSMAEHSDTTAAAIAQSPPPTEIETTTAAVDTLNDAHTGKSLQPETTSEPAKQHPTTQHVLNESSSDTKHRRKRRRRKNHQNNSPSHLPDDSPALFKTLQGATAAERLRFTALLNEFCQLIATP